MSIEEEKTLSDDGSSNAKNGELVDKTLVCKDCGNEFIFSVGEQEFYAEKGFENEPLRCKECRIARKNAMRNNNGERVYYEAVCAQCGGPARIPFEPRDDRPVYCSECFAKRKSQQEGDSNNAE